jgi:hypothetical protein
MICVHIWSVSAVSFHSAKGRGGQNSSRLFPVIFTWNEVLLAAFDLRATLYRIQATHLNANIEQGRFQISRMQAFVAYATKVRHHART